MFHLHRSRHLHHIQIQPMLRLNATKNAYVGLPYTNSNTTNVKVKQISF